MFGELRASLKRLEAGQRELKAALEALGARPGGPLESGIDNLLAYDGKRRKQPPQPLPLEGDELPGWGEIPPWLDGEKGGRA